MMEDNIEPELRVVIVESKGDKVSCPNIVVSIIKYQPVLRLWLE